MPESHDELRLYVVIHFSLSNVTAVIIFYGVLINGCRYTILFLLKYG